MLGPAIFDSFQQRYACLSQGHGPDLWIAAVDGYDPIIVSVDDVTVTVLRLYKSLPARADSLPSSHRPRPQPPKQWSEDELGRFDLNDPKSLPRLEEFLDSLCRPAS